MGVALLDSNTAIGFLDAEDLLHPAADAALKAAATEHVLAVSVVTVAELLTGARLGHHDEPTVRRFFAQGSAGGSRSTSLQPNVPLSPERLIRP